MKTTTTNQKSVKLVWVAGIQVPADKAEGRIKALRHAREMKAKYNAIEAQRLAEETDEMLKQGYTMTEINCLRHANRIKQMESQGFGTSQRCRIGFPC